MLPRDTVNMLYMYPEKLTADSKGASSDIVRSVIFAMLCSYPDVINAYRHQNIIMSFPLSLLHLKLHHTARQTRILHNSPLKKEE